MTDFPLNAKKGSPIDMQKSQINAACFLFFFTRYTLKDLTELRNVLGKLSPITLPRNCLSQITLFFQKSLIFPKITYFSKNHFNPLSAQTKTLEEVFPLKRGRYTSCISLVLIVQYLICVCSL